MVARRKVQVRQSSIHGRGLFALVDVPSGTRLIEYTGELIGWAVAQERHDDAGVDGHTFFFDVEDDLVLDGNVGGSDARWANHGCVPNVEAFLDGHRVFFDTIVDVAAGDELLLDYALIADDLDEARKVYRCRCGAMSCRGTMVGD